MDGSLASLQLNDQDPWPGSAPYDASLQPFFHGRDAEREDLLRMILASPYVALVGDAGIGKTSLLLAGTLPDLRPAHGLPVHLQLDWSAGAPHPIERQTMARLQQEAAGAQAEVDPPDPGESLWMYLQRRDRPMWTADEDPITPVLIFDGFEAVFAPDAPAGHVEAVLSAMADLVAHRLPTRVADDAMAVRRLNLQAQQYRVVLSLRADALGPFVEWEHRANLPRRESLHLTALAHAQALQAISSAGAAVLAPDAAPAIIDVLLAGPGHRGGGAGGAGGAGIAGRGGGAGSVGVEPALLSMFCQQLNQHRPRGELIDAVQVRSMGDFILKDLYAQALVELPERVALFVEAHLIQGDVCRNAYSVDEALASGALRREEVATLIQRRLLRLDVAGDVPRLKLIHDRLVPVVKAARDARLARQREFQLAQEREQLATTVRTRERIAVAEHACRRAIAWRNAWAGVSFVLATALGVVAVLRWQGEPQTTVATAGQAEVAQAGTGKVIAASDTATMVVAASSASAPAPAPAPAPVPAADKTPSEPTPAAAVTAPVAQQPEAKAEPAPPTIAAAPVAPQPEAKVAPATPKGASLLSEDRFPEPPPDAAVFPGWRIQSRGCKNTPIVVTGTMRFWSRNGTLFSAFTSAPEANGGWTVSISGRTQLPAVRADGLALKNTGQWSDGRRSFRTEGTDFVRLSGGRVVGAEMQTMRTVCGA